jgi:hypothetical protein
VGQPGSTRPPAGPPNLLCQPDLPPSAFPPTCAPAQRPALECQRRSPTTRLRCCCPDLLGDSPSPGLDALYGALAAILGLNIYNERKVLVERGAEQQGPGGGGGGSKGDR